MGMVVLQQKEPKIPGAHKISVAISGPRIVGGKITDMRLFLVCAKVCPLSGWNRHGTGPNTFSESTASNTELSDLFGPHRVPGRELSEFLAACYLTNTICLQNRTHRVVRRTHQVAAELSEFSLPKQYCRKQYSAGFLMYRSKTIPQIHSK